MADLTRDLRIRAAVEVDLPRMIELARRSWLSAFAQTAPFDLIAWWARTDRTRRLYEAAWREMHVLEERALLLGLVHTIRDEINGLWIHPAQQGKGFGSRLLVFGEELVRTRGHDVAWLTCSALNASALGFYRARGYRETSRTRYVHDSGIEIEDVRLERSLVAN